MTRFVNPYGQVTGRDPKILDSLEVAFRNSALPLLAQAGTEIELLQAEVTKLKQELAVSKKDKQK